MAFIQTRQVSVGQLISETFQRLGMAKREIALYLGGFFVIGMLGELVPGARDLVGLPATIVYFVAQYYLYRILLERDGMRYDPRFKVFSFFGMAVLLSLPLYFGFALLIIPGLLLASKWIMAPTYLVAEDVNVFDALGASWHASDNNAWTIAGAFTVMCLIWFALTAFGGGLSSGFAALLGFSDTKADGFTWVFIHTLPLMLMGLSISAYRALGNDENDIAAVFE